MTPEEEKKHQEQVSALASLLNQIPDVRRHDEDEATQGEIMAHGLTDIADEADEILYLVNLLRSPNMSESKRLEVLRDIGEALGHIDYHIHDMAFFDTYIDEEIEN